MKKFTFMLLLLSAFASYAQNGPITFEPGEPGADWTWNVFENDANPPLEVIANPDPTGANTSATVAQFTALQAGQPFAGVESQQTVDLGAFEWNEDNRTVTIMVWKSVISDVGIKFDTPTGWSQGEIKVANTVVNQWEELTFDFSSFINPPESEGMLDRIIIFPDFDLDGRTQDNVVYFDNITFGEGGGGNPSTEPMVAAPAPTQDEADVISLFSDVYTDVPVDTWRTDWSAAVLEDVEIQGNPTKKYSSLDFVGIETVANQVDATGMTHIHLDVWSAGFTSFSVKLVDFGADGAFGGGDDTEHQVDFASPAQGQWLGIDIPLDDFVGMTSRANIAQYILVAQPSGAATVWVDNMYFYNGENTGPAEPMTAAPDPMEDAANVISLFSDTYTDVPVDTWRTDWSAATLEDIEIEGNPTKKYSGLDFVGIETVANQVDATGMTHIHLDVWSPDFTFFGVKLVDFGADGAFDGGDDTEDQINFEMPGQGEWIGIDIPLDDFAGMTSRSNIAQYILVAQPTGAATVYVDNVYFYNDLGSSTLDEGLEAKGVRAFPNPVRLGEAVQLSEQPVGYEVFDLSGRLVLSAQGTATVNTAQLSQRGVYLLKARLKDGSEQVQRLIVQ
ncbi:T9SS type A sorting domain-containing protein [Phaeodactylibacter luteus]|uniref:T9SS type A sorting domain-containing protein n=1 Tax=Phaeodactylibacter luteus TaxID=1564516 RepID=A0A5C6RIA6_9BACT|nr:T9SS type A sorting domain-containing protein [Phaeodactylibacter luteus]TXB60084.1 T9SS type A sorting domain-containing protein [Phaeodactylibacter luteus]